VRRLYDERSLIKYDSGDFRFGDVLELTHPAPVTVRQGELFGHAIDRRHGRGQEIPESLTTLRARAELLALPVARRRALLDHPDATRALADAGMTWESVAGWLQGPLTARFWKSRFGGLGGTNTAAAIRAHYNRHDRVVIVTDEQGWSGWAGEDPARAVPDRVPVYTWNLVGYRYGHGPSGTGTRHTFAGLSDAAFAMVPLVESGRHAAWPF
jgi:hypothetical protein